MVDDMMMIAPDAVKRKGLEIRNKCQTAQPKLKGGNRGSGKMRQKEME